MVPFPGSIGAGEGRRWELGGAGTAGNDARAELDSGRGRGDEGEEEKSDLARDWMRTA